MPPPNMECSTQMDTRAYNPVTTCLLPSTIFWWPTGLCWCGAFSIRMSASQNMGPMKKKSWCHTSYTTTTHIAENALTRRDLSSGSLWLTYIQSFVDSWSSLYLHSVKVPWVQKAKFSACTPMEYSQLQLQSLSITFKSSWTHATFLHSWCSGTFSPKVCSSLSYSFQIRLRTRLLEVELTQSSYLHLWFKLC